MPLQIEDKLNKKIYQTELFEQIFSFLNDTDLMEFMLTSKQYRELIISVHYYRSLIVTWADLLSSDIKIEQMNTLKAVAVKMYERGLIRRIIDDLNKVNLKSVIIPALLDGYVFKPENHACLELASHLLFFNKNSDILYAQDGENNDKFPLFHETESMLERYAKKTQRDCFYLIFTDSAQVIYYNKLTRSAKVFICPNAGWGLYRDPKDHVFSVLLSRRIGHVDCLVDVPNIALEANINLRDISTLERAIQDGRLYLSFYRSYIQTYVDQEREYHSFERLSGYKGHYLKTNPEASHGYKRNGRLEQFIDYLMENHFPMLDNNIYNAKLEDRTAIVLHESQYLEKFIQDENTPIQGSMYYKILGRGLSMFSHASTINAGRKVLKALKFPATSEEQLYGDHLDLNPFGLSKTISHPYYSEKHFRLDSKEDLIAFLIHASDKLEFLDYGKTILQRLDCGYLVSLFLKDNLCSWHDVETWLRENDQTHEKFPALRQCLHDIFERGIVQKPRAQISSLEQSTSLVQKDMLLGRNMKLSMFEQSKNSAPQAIVASIFSPVGGFIVSLALKMFLNEGEETFLSTDALTSSIKMGVCFGFAILLSSAFNHRFPKRYNDDEIFLFGAAVGIGMGVFNIQSKENQNAIKSSAVSWS